ncbi:C-methyltransferase [Candidatus Promineifilum breve]|uniref:C-methyltransferase n=1 Tax=Candidatus Promineifilum breve TaxID=1806508 RepID=A0A170PDI7_9CHLR|nr:class I SAM-dependent methyltransferase [Candidatus Promineifilum breve]CUS02037.2 C-methyltransferase [Candidatus Promineifilum breve]
MRQVLHACPACGAAGMAVFYEVRAVPVNSVLLVTSRDEAMNFQTGDIALAACPACGFISNIAFDEALTQYTAQYEATQGYSPTFNKFHKALAQDLIDRFDLHGKDIIELGCDKGDFITMLVEMGDNRGVGFDPAYVPGRHPSPAADRLTFIADFYGEQYADYRADFICCKMTLEHIPDVGRFVATVRRSIGDNGDTVVFFQIPNARYVLCDVAFWDIYYEHCSYFTKGSLARLFRANGFEVKNLWTAYDDQYLMIEARPGQSAGEQGRKGAGEEELDGEESVTETMEMVRYFVEHYEAKRNEWRAALAGWQAASKKVVLWGGGSKGVAFLTTLGQSLDDIAYAVDINPIKTGTFMAGTGQEIVAPAFLKEYQPDVVIIMNPVYREEISRDLQAMGLAPEIRTL